MALPDMAAAWRAAVHEQTGLPVPGEEELMRHLVYGESTPNTQVWAEALDLLVMLDGAGLPLQTPLGPDLITPSQALPEHFQSATAPESDQEQPLSRAAGFAEQSQHADQKEQPPQSQPAQTAPPTQPEHGGGRHSRPAQAAPSSAGQTATPASAPAAVPAAAPSAQQLDLAEDDFEELDLLEDLAVIPGGGVRAKLNEDGEIQVKWALPEDYQPQPVQIFRVVSDEEVFDRDPAEGILRAATPDTFFADSDPLTFSYRYYQVWLNEGANEIDALRSQPKLVGDDYYVRPVEHIELNFDGSEVSGKWEEFRHTDRVSVYIAPEEERRRLTRRSHEVSQSSRNVNGFRWTPPQRGLTYAVQAVREVSVNGSVKKSAHSEIFTIDIGAEVVEVHAEVQLDQANGNGLFNVRWELPNSGEVRIYRTRELPAEGLSDKVVETDQLEGFGLPLAAWVNDIAEAKDATEFAWPKEWYSIAITPVSVVGNKARVGRSSSFVRVGSIPAAKIEERVIAQLITFGWPEQAHEVAAFLAEPGEGGLVNPRRADAKPMATIDEQEYRSEGGMRVEMRGARDVVLIPSRMHAGLREWGEPTIIPYRGLRHFRYMLTAGPDNGLYLFVNAENEETQHRRFTLRYHPERLPLEPTDGEPVRVSKINGGYVEDYKPVMTSDHLFPDNLVPGTPGFEYWRVDPELVARNYGWLRLFIADAPLDGESEVALRDPDVRTLWYAYNFQQPGGMQ